MTQGSAHQELCRTIKKVMERSGYTVQQEKRIYLKRGGYVAVDLFAKDENGQIVIVECGYTERIRRFEDLRETYPSAILVHFPYLTMFKYGSWSGCQK